MNSVLFVPSTLVKSFMNFKANWGPLLLRTFCDILCIFHILSQYIFAIFSDETIVVVALSLIILVNQSIITTITSLSFDLRSGPIISILISYHGSSSVSNGWSFPAFFMCCTLFCWYLVHPWTYFLISFLFLATEKFLLINLSILCCPEYPTFAGLWFFHCCSNHSPERHS